MNNKNNKFKITNRKAIISILAGFSIIAVSGLFNKVFAQMESPLIVAPARQSLSADPGSNVSFAVRFYNTASMPISGTFKAADFIVMDNQGTPTFLDGPTALSERFSAAKWVTLNTNKGTIAGSGMVTINGTVKVPSNASAGGKYFAVFFEPDTNVPEANGSKQQEAASVTMRLAGLVYLKVNGAIAEGANVVRFSAPGFSEYGPIAVTTEIKNSGDYHIAPTGEIEIKDMFGQVVAKAGLMSNNIFPDASRVTVTKIGEKWMVGRFTASLNATYGDSNKPLSASIAFWVFPWKVATVTVLVLIIVILSIYLIINKFVKKEKKLESELKAEKSELESLKEKFEDQIKDTNSPTENSTDKKDTP